MSNGEHSVADPRSTWHMYRALVGVGALCALAIVTVFQLTLPIITRNRAEALERAIFQVLPEARARITFAQSGQGAFEPLDGEAGDPVVHAGYDDTERLVGFAIEAKGMGYQDDIKVIYGYSPERQVIIGIQVLESRETPGLGDRIEKDAEFLQNFVALDASLSEDGMTLRHRIETVKHGKKTEPWQIDGITGATISSQAIGRILDLSSQEWLPVLNRQLQEFRKPEHDDEL